MSGPVLSGDIYHPKSGLVGTTKCRLPILPTCHVVASIFDGEAMVFSLKFLVRPAMGHSRWNPALTMHLRSGASEARDQERKFEQFYF